MSNLSILQYNIHKSCNIIIVSFFKTKVFLISILLHFKNYREIFKTKQYTIYEKTYSTLYILKAIRSEFVFLIDKKIKPST